MKILKFGHDALGVLVAGAMLVGCSGPLAPSGLTGVAGGALHRMSQETHVAAVPVCGSDRVQTAQCDVLIQTGLRADEPAGYTPADLQSAYNLPSSSGGSGQVVAVVDAYDNPNVASDLEARNTVSQHGLPAYYTWRFRVCSG